MDALSRAYLDVMLALAAWRAAKDVESQVAHWLTEDRATHADLVAARAETAKAQRVHAAARRRYSRLCIERMQGVSPARPRVGARRQVGA